MVEVTVIKFKPSPMKGKPEFPGGNGKDLVFCSPIELMTNFLINVTISWLMAITLALAPQCHFVDEMSNLI